MDPNYCRRLMEEVIAVMRSCGTTDSQIAEAFEAAVSSSRSDRVELYTLSESADFHLACCDAVFRWRHEPDFLDISGTPRRLAASGRPPSFESLISDAKAGSPERCLKYLQALGAVRQCLDGTVELLTDSVLACSGRRGAFVSPKTVLSHLVDFVSTVRFNLETKESNEGGRFERACFGRIPSSYIPILQRLLDDRGQNFIDGVDEWLARHRSTDAELSDIRMVGVGAYMYVRPEEPESN
jgi:hypothetical protein